MKKLIALALLLLPVLGSSNGEVTSPNMSMPVPSVGITTGPQYATDLVDSLNIIDAHDHSPGKGAYVTPSGLNINADLTINDNNLTTARSVRFDAQGSPISNAADVGAIYVSGVDLYYNDGNGNSIRLTQGGSIVGTSGSISGLSAPASASYVSGSSTFIWQSAVNTSANMDGGCYIMRDVTASSNGITICAPAALASNYAITWPASLPASKKIATIDSSGNVGDNYDVDNTTLSISSNLLQVKDSGITLAKLAAEVLAKLVPSGAIEAYGGTSAPTGWLLCDGTSYLRATYPDLYTAIGNAYGTADGTHFNVPDFRGQFLRGVSGASSNDPNKTTRTAMATGGNTGNNVGSIQAGQVGPHTHGLSVFYPGPGDDTLNFLSVESGNFANSTGNTTLGSSVLTNGTSENRPINAYVNYIIKQ